MPLIVMYIVIGIMVGPSIIDLDLSKDKIFLLVEIGISILLFIVGFKLDLRLNKVNREGCTNHQVLAGIIHFGSWLLNSIRPAVFSSSQPLYFCSTHDFEHYYYREVIFRLKRDRFSAWSDCYWIFDRSGYGSHSGYDHPFSNWSDVQKSLADNMFLILIFSIAFVAVTLEMMKWIIPSVTFHLAKSIELLSLFAIAWAITLASVSEIIGFSAEVGAFLAGVSLASSPFKEAISSRLTSIRDFLLLFFFVNLGANLNLEAIGGQIIPAIIFSLFVLIGNPIIVLIIMGLMGYRKRTSFLAGLTVAQISEFSLIFAGLGLQVGHLNENIVGLINLVGLITIGISTYLIIYSYPIYEFLSPVFFVFQRKKYSKKEEMTSKQGKYDLIIFGLGRFGSKLAD